MRAAAHKRGNENSGRQRCSPDRCLAGSAPGRSSELTPPAVVRRVQSKQAGRPRLARERGTRNRGLGTAGCVWTATSADDSNTVLRT